MSKQLKKALHQKSSSPPNDTSLFIEEVPSFLKKLLANYSDLQEKDNVGIAPFLLPVEISPMAGYPLANSVHKTIKSAPSSSVISKAKNYLVRKYFEGLYSFQLPLHYFSKSTISKLESAYNVSTLNHEQIYGNFPPNSSVNRKQSLIKVLADSILSIEKFDSRYLAMGAYLKGNISEVSDNDFLKNPIEKEAFDKFLRKIQFSEIESLIKMKNLFKANNASDFSLRKLVLEIIDSFLLFLKIRESQIQIILLMEYIHLNIKDIESSATLVNKEDLSSSMNQNTSTLSPPISPMFSAFANKPIIRPRRLSSRQRALKRSISVPNVTKSHFSNLEMTAPEETPSKSASSIKNINFYKQLLDTYLDRLLIWDALKETKNHPIESTELLLIKVSNTSMESDSAEEEHIDIFSIKKIFSNELVIPKKFVSKILVPYFDYKCPSLTEFICSKVSGNVKKGTKRNSRLSVSSQKSFDNSERINSSSSLNLSRDEDFPLNRNKESMIKKRKSIRRSQTEASVSFFSRESSTLTSSDLKLAADKSPASSSSSSSSLITAGSNKVSKLFGKREVDFAFAVPATKSKSLSLSEDILRKPKFISRAKSSLKSGKMKSFSQIDSTPTKATKNLKIPSAEIAHYKKSLLDQLAEIDSLDKLK